MQVPATCAPMLAAAERPAARKHCLSQAFSLQQNSRVRIAQKQTLMAMTAALALAVALPTLAGAQGPVGAGGGGFSGGRGGGAHRRQVRAARRRVRSALAGGGERPAAGRHPAAISRHAAAATGKVAETGSIPAGIIAARSSPMASGRRTSTITQRPIPTTTGATVAGPIASCAERTAACGFATDLWHERRATAAGRTRGALHG